VAAAQDARRIATAKQDRAALRTLEAILAVPHG
jgi:hypothetical protein